MRRSIHCGREGEREKKRGESEGEKGWGEG